MEKITQIISFKRDYSKWFRCLCCFLFLIIGDALFAQANIYSFAQTNGTYTAITGGTVINTATDGTPTLDSYVSPSITLPTAFTFAGTSYTTMYVTSNGQIQLGGASAPSAFEYKVISASTGNNVFIAPFSADLGVGAAGTATIRWEQVGDEIVIQWANFRRWAKVESFSFQARLNTTSGVIKFVYNGTPPYAVSTDYQPQLGIKSSTTAYNCLTVGTTGDWNTPTQITTGISSSSIATFNGPIGFTNGLTYTFSPPQPCSGTPVAGTISGSLTRTVCSGSAPGVINVGGATPAIPGISYQWEESINGTDWGNAVGGTGATTVSYTPPNYAGTPIQYRLKVTCANGGGFAVSDVLSVGNQIAPATQVTAVAAPAASLFHSAFTLNWTNGNGARRLVIISPVTIVDPVDNTGDITANRLYAGTGQQIVYDGTGTSVNVINLACSTSYFVKVYEYNRCGAAAPYSYYYNVTAGTNAITVATPALPAAVALPVTNDFNSFTGANLSGGWYEAILPTTSGQAPLATAPVPNASDWTNRTFGGSTTAKVNLYYNDNNDWIISPRMTISDLSRLKFKAAITAYDSSGAATDGGMQGTDDKVRVLISTDPCGANWTTLYTFEAANTTTLTNVLTDFVIPLGATYVGQTVQIAFQGTDGIINDTPDYDFHIDSIVVEAVPACGVPLVAAPTNITKNSVTISWTAPPEGVPTGYQYVVSTTSTPPAGAGTPGTGTTTTQNVGSLLPSTEYYVYVRTACGADFGDWSVVRAFTTLCDYPDITGTTPGTRCGVGTVDLAAASAGTIKWYAAATGGTALTTGAAFTTPLITETTTYYAGSQLAVPGTTVVGTATTTTTDTEELTAFCNRRDTYRSQTIYTAAELTAAGLLPGNIVSIAYNIATVGDADDNDDFTVKIGTTANAAFTNTTYLSETGFTTVYGPATYTHAVGLNTITFTTPFPWDGTSNIVISVSHSGADDINNAQTFYTDLGANTTLYNYNNLTAATGTSSTKRFNIVFGGQVACNSPRVPVVATVTPPPAFTLSGNPAAICNGGTTSPVTITAGAADYDTFVWAPSTGVSGTAAAGWTFNPTATTAYTLTATNSVSGCGTTAAVNITVNSLPVIITDVADATVCEGSIQQLSFVSGLSNSAVSGTAATASVAQSTSGTLGPNPLQNYWGGVKQQWIYTAAELTAMGFTAGSQITAISLDLATANTTLALSNFSIKMKNTPQAAFATTTSWITGMVTVRPAASYTPVVGINNFTLATPFAWDGTSNIAVQMSFSNENAPTEGTNSAKFSPTAFVSTIYYRADNNTAAAIESFTGTASYTYSTRNNVTFTFSAPVPTTWAPLTSLYTDAAATVAYTGTNASTVYAKPAADVTYTATGTSAAGCTVTSTADITITITPAPAATATQTFCGTATVANLSATGTAIKWYITPTGGTALAAAVGLSDGFVYYASQTVGGCESMIRTAVTADVNVTAPPTVAEEVQEFCNTATINDLDATGTDVLWYDSPTGGTALTDTDVITEGISLYYASQTVDGCESSIRAAVAVFVNVTEAPIADIAQTICNTGTVADLTTASGQGILWYDDATAGTALADSTELVDGESYFASQTIDGCESSTRAEVVVTINIVDAPEASIAQTVCNAGTVADLTTSTGSGILWYEEGTGGTALAATTELVDGENYFASQTIDGCESLARAEVIATINITNAPDAPAVQSFCNSGTIADLETTSGENILWYADAEGGTALEVTTALIDGDSYFASQTIDGCESAVRFEITVSINVVNAPAGEGTQEVPADSTLEDIVLEGVIGTVTWYATLEDAQAAVNPIEVATILEDGENYFAAQTVEGCTSADVFEVTIDVVLDARDFDAKAFRYYPNPVKDVLKVSYSSNISEITVYNLLGQPVMSQKFNTLEANLDMSNLSDGTYMLNITSGDMVKTVKVIKKQ